MATSLEIAVVEDHDQLRRVMTTLLTQRGHRVVGLSCAEELDDGLSLTKPDVYVLDLNLPGEDGLSLAKRIRAAHPRVGIIMTTVRTELKNRLDGYESGADVYLPKPTDIEELVAAVETLGRRVRDPENMGSTSPNGSKELHALPIESDQQELFERPPGLPPLILRTAEVEAFARVTLDMLGLTVIGALRSETLTEAEARLLAAFARAPGLTLERWQVAIQLGQPPDEFSEASMEVRVGRLRKKLKAASGQERPVRAQRGVGYRLCLRVVVLD